MEPEYDDQAQPLKDVILRYFEPPAIAPPAVMVTPPEAKAPAVGAVRRAVFMPEVRSFDESRRELTFCVSSEATDRYGDRILVSGWDFRSYLKNAVVLWSHKSDVPPVGRTTSLKIETAPVPALVATIEFATADANPLAEQVYQLYRGGFMNAVSVGFRPTVAPTPITNEDGTTGWEFRGQELLEISAVNIPANSDALKRAIDEGVIPPETRALFEAPTTKASDAASEALRLEREVWTKVHQQCDLIKAGLDGLGTLVECLKKLESIQAQLGTEPSDLDKFLGALESKPVVSMDDLERALRGGQ